MNKLVFIVSLFILSTASFAQSCKTPIKIEVYDRASGHTANLLKVKLAVGSTAKVKIENITRDEYDRPVRRLPYVYSNPTIHFKANTDKACVALATRSLTSMGFEVSEISYRPYAYGHEVGRVRISIPPRTFLYEHNGTLSVKSL